MPEPRDKAEGWFVLHDMRKLEWGALKTLDEDDLAKVADEASSYLEDASDVGEGDSGLYGVVGDKADLMQVHIRATVEELDQVERGFEQTALADYTLESASYVSVTEIGGYTNQDVAEGNLSGYAEKKLFPSIPDRRYVSFYPMSRRRGEQFNWYTLPHDRRREMMHEHRETGEAYAGDVEQLISGSIGLDDWEWGVDLFVDDLRYAKQIVYEMRFDEASSRYSEFGPFYTGVHLAPDDLQNYLEGEATAEPTEGPRATSSSAHGGSQPKHDESGANPHGLGEDDDIRSELEEMGVYGGKPHGEDVYALVLYSEEDAEALADDIDGLRGNFEHYDSHVKTEVYRDFDGEDAAVVSIWDTEEAAETAAGFLSDLPGVVGRAGEREEGFGTMGMFYQVKPDHRGDFLETFDEVGAALGEMEGHSETKLYACTRDENDMFIASNWRSKEDAMEFFRSEAFRDTVSWGREILDDTPRHVFLA